MTEAEKLSSDIQALEVKLQECKDNALISAYKLIKAGKEKKLAGLLGESKDEAPQAPVEPVDGGGRGKIENPEVVTATEESGEGVACESCGRMCANLAGMKAHMRHCEKK